MLNLKHGLLMKVHYCMKSYRYESRCAEYSTPPDRYFCLYSALPLLLFCLCLSCTQLSLYILCAACGLIPRLLCLLQPKKEKNKTNKQKKQQKKQQQQLGLPWIFGLFGYPHKNLVSGCQNDIRIRPRDTVHVQFVSEIGRMSTRKCTSPVWEFFELTEVAINEKKFKAAICKLCEGVSLAYIWWGN